MRGVLTARRALRSFPVALQFARKRTRITFLSYSASVAIVISAPSAAKTRPPLARQLLRSYWHGPISGCLLQSAATFGANAIAVCCCLPFASITQTYCVLGGTTIFAAGAPLEGAVPVGGDGGGMTGVSSGRRATADPATSDGGVVTSGCGAEMQPASAAS